VFFLVYAGLFPIVNPVGNAPIFLALTRYYTKRERHALALRVAINGFFLLLGSLLVGSYVLEFFGITLPVLRIAGGVVVTAFGGTLSRADRSWGISALPRPRRDRMAVGFARRAGSIGSGVAAK
jgi:multiple antibiotic resistance protein